MDSSTLTQTADHMLPEPEEALVNGWDQSTPVSDNIVGNYLATLVDRLLSTARLTEGRWKSTDNALFMDLASAYIFDNTAVCFGPLSDVDIDEVCETAADFFPDGRQWTLLCLNARTDLAHKGLSLLGHPPLMYRPLGGQGPAVPPGLRILPVTTRAELADFERTLVDAYPLPRGSSVVDPRILGPEFKAWVGYVDGVAVATAGSHTAHGLTEVEWVSTRSTHRGQGIAAALTWQATMADPTAPAVLIATDDGRPVYERLGYLPLLRLTMWAHM